MSPTHGAGNEAQKHMAGTQEATVEVYPLLTLQETIPGEGICVFSFGLTLEILVGRHLGLTMTGENSECTVATKPLAVYRFSCLVLGRT